mmetsp:Transcript_3764/g.6468  ORF Transcript_3764/g.6468 Transcript_3764/m.6468 type:complete len:89 (+) Transcript_3764:1505-1771(+)
MIICFVLRSDAERNGLQSLLSRLLLQFCAPLPLSSLFRTQHDSQSALRRPSFVLATLFSTSFSTSSRLSSRAIYFCAAMMYVVGRAGG